MRAAVFQGPGQLELQERPQPNLENSDQVLLRVRACGICGTDLHILAVPPKIVVPPGAILGHEYVASVVECGASVNGFQPGDQVVVEPTLSCQECEYCRQGFPNSCARPRIIGVHHDGGMAEYSVVPARALHKICSDVPTPLAALVEPLACVVHGANQVQPKPAESALVLGGGPIGLLFVQLLRAVGVGKIVVAERSETRAAAAETCGADHATLARGNELVTVVHDQFGLGADMVVDTTGALFDIALQAARRNGRILLFGLNAHARPTIPQSLITRNELAVFGSFGARNTFPQAVRLVESGKLALEPIVTHQLPLAQAAAAIEILERGEGIKVLLIP